MFDKHLPAITKYASFVCTRALVRRNKTGTTEYKPVTKDHCDRGAAKLSPAVSRYYPLALLRCHISWLGMREKLFYYLARLRCRRVTARAPVLTAFGRALPERGRNEGKQWVDG